jgi:hypothetical protein
MCEIVRDFVEDKTAEAKTSLVISFLNSVTNRHIHGEAAGLACEVKKK